MQNLPPEIKFKIASFLEVDDDLYGDSIPQKPRFTKSTTTSAAGPLISLSTVCKEWHLIIRPRLFSRLAIPINDISSGRSNATNRLRYSMKLAADKLNNLPLTREGQSAQVESLTIEINLAIDNDAPPRNPAKHSTDILSMNDFWRQIFEAINPQRFSIVATPGIMGWLTYTPPRLEHSWAFDMDVQRLELSQQATGNPPRGHLPSVRDRGAAAWDTEYLFNVRPWSHMRLLEGSMMKAYGTYEYFNQTPPSIFGGLDLPRSDTLTSFSLHCLFPFNSHVEELQLLSLSHYRKLHFHFTPAPNMHILDDPVLIGKADLADCWRETEQIYQRALDQHSMFGPTSQVIHFSTGDYAVESIRRLLEDGFAKLGMYGWYSHGNGSWSRTKSSEQMGPGSASRAPWA